MVNKVYDLDLFKETIDKNSLSRSNGEKLIDNLIGFISAKMMTAPRQDRPNLIHKILQVIETNTEESQGDDGDFDLDISDSERLMHPVDVQDLHNCCRVALKIAGVANEKIIKPLPSAALSQNHIPEKSSAQRSEEYMLSSFSQDSLCQKDDGTFEFLLSSIVKNKVHKAVYKPGLEDDLQYQEDETNEDAVANFMDDLVQGLKAAPRKLGSALDPDSQSQLIAMFKNHPTNRIMDEIVKLDPGLAIMLIVVIAHWQTMENPTTVFFKNSELKFSSKVSVQSLQDFYTINYFEDGAKDLANESYQLTFKDETVCFKKKSEQGWVDLKKFSEQDQYVFDRLVFELVQNVVKYSPASLEEILKEKNINCDFLKNILNNVRETKTGPNGRRTGYLNLATKNNSIPLCYREWKIVLPATAARPSGIFNNLITSFQAYLQHQDLPQDTVLNIEVLNFEKIKVENKAYATQYILGLKVVGGNEAGSAQKITSIYFNRQCVDPRDLKNRNDILSAFDELYNVNQSSNFQRIFSE